MSAQIVNLVSCCSVCPTERTNAPKWYSQFTPDIACCRYLSTGKKAILIYIVDYYDVIQAFKGQFAHFGICQTHVTNAGSCFTSYEFSQFAKDWECAHVTTSPKLSRSNGMAEDTIQTVKNVVKKAKAAQQDPMLAILYYKNIPIILHISPFVSTLLMMTRYFELFPIYLNFCWQEICKRFMFYKYKITQHLLISCNLCRHTHVSKTSLKLVVEHISS